jgi:thiosulfate reductase cytochrome b subunit
MNPELKALYLHAFSRVKLNELAMTQQDNFLKLYGFARNISFSLLISSPFIIGHCVVRGFAHNWHWFFIFLISAIAMFYVYLKFYRWHTRELFLAYSELPPQQSVGDEHKSEKIN